MLHKPETIANVNVKNIALNNKLRGLKLVNLDDFILAFNKGSLLVNPPLGRALIHDTLLRFLLKKDYELEAGNEYRFTISEVLISIFSDK